MEFGTYCIVKQLQLFRRWYLTMYIEEGRVACVSEFGVVVPWREGDVQQARNLYGWAFGAALWVVEFCGKVFILHRVQILSS